VITLTDYWMGRDKEYAASLTDAIRENAARTVSRANLLLMSFKDAGPDWEARHVTSGWRPPQVNFNTPGAAARSKHMSGEAIDIADPEGDLDEWCMANPLILANIGLWQEHPSATKGWCHVQTVPPKSGNRVFYP
jgi:hypothetical protein